MQLATFRVGESLIGVEILLVKEIHRMLALTPVPGASQVFRGLVNLRGKIVTVIDMNEALGQERDDERTNQKLLVLKTADELLRVRGAEHIVEDLDQENDDMVGLLIDTMEEGVTVDSSDILPVPTNLDETKKKLISGVIKQDDELILLLHVSELLRQVHETV